MRYIFLVLSFTIVLNSKVFYDQTQDRDKIDFMEKAKQEITLMHQESLSFKNIYYNVGITGIELVCGEHAKARDEKVFYNFIYINQKYVFFENSSRNFDKIWYQLCEYDNRRTSVFYN